MIDKALICKTYLYLTKTINIPNYTTETEQQAMPTLIHTKKHHDCEVFLKPLENNFPIFPERYTTADIQDYCENCKYFMTKTSLHPKFKEPRTIQFYIT